MSGDMPEHPDEAVQIWRQLAALDLERNRLAARLDELQRAPVAVPAEPPRQTAPDAGISNKSPASEKVALFRRLFAGRGGPGSLDKNSASLSRASAGVRLPCGVAAG